MYVPSDKSVSMAILRVMKENPNGIDYKKYLKKYLVDAILQFAPFGNYKDFLSSTKNFTMTVIHMPKNILVLSQKLTRKVKEI